MTNTMPMNPKADLYFIRTKSNKKNFLHPDNDGYIVKEGTVGACLWKKKEVTEFIKEMKYYDLEMVHQSEIIK